MLDSNIIIRILNASGAALRQRMAAADDGDFVTSSVAYAEVAFGSAKGKPPAFDRLERFVSKVPVLAFDYNAARAYATLPLRRASYHRLIAAHALSHDLVVITDNVSHFFDVPRLKVENWTL